MKIRWQDYIEERKEIMAGKPTFQGTRLTVQFILRKLSADMSHAELLDQYPECAIESDGYDPNAKGRELKLKSLDDVIRWDDTVRANSEPSKVPTP